MQTIFLFNALGLGTDVLAVHARRHVAPAHVDAILARLDGARSECGVLGLGQHDAAIGGADDAVCADGEECNIQMGKYC